MAEPAPDVERARALRPRVRCTYCHDAVERGAAVHCASCLAPHHAGCHVEHGRCAAPGCDDPRGLVPDPDGRPARAVVAPSSKGKGVARRPRRALAVALLAVVAAACGVSWWAWPAAVSVAVTPAVHVPPPAPVAGALTTPPARVVVLERVSREVALVARDFRLPVVLARGERLVVETGERGYTHVVLEPPAGSGRAPEARFVAEPGDAVEVVTGPRGARERVRAGPGEAVVLEAVGGGPEHGPDDGQLRVTLVR